MATYFVTGTDTEIGKTFCSRILLQEAQQRGKNAFGFKPVASEADNHGHNTDVLLLQTASSKPKPYCFHNCYTFKKATAPHLAAEEEGLFIEPGKISRQLRNIEKEFDFVLVEGAGGWFTPLNEDVNFADWVKDENLAVIMVVGMRLGCINHALLTAQAISCAGLSLVGWIANCISVNPHALNRYLFSLKQRIQAPFLGLVPFDTEKKIDLLVEHIDFDHLLIE